MRKEQLTTIFWWLLAGSFLYKTVVGVGKYGLPALTWLLLVIPCLVLGVKCWLKQHPVDREL